jgi:hypothetical protein
MNFTIIKTQNQGLSIDQAEQLSTLMSRIEDENLPSDIRHSSYFLLIQIKSEMLDEELYEQMKDFKFLEDLHQIAIPVDQMSLL